MRNAYEGCSEAQIQKAIRGSLGSGLFSDVVKSVNISEAPFTPAQEARIVEIVGAVSGRLIQAMTFFENDNCKSVIRSIALDEDRGEAAIKDYFWSPVSEESSNDGT